MWKLKNPIAFWSQEVAAPQRPGLWLLCMVPYLNMGAKHQNRSLLTGFRVKGQVRCPIVWPGDTAVLTANFHFILKLPCDKIHWKRVREVRKHVSNEWKAIVAICGCLPAPNLSSPVQYFTLNSRGSHGTGCCAHHGAVLHPQHSLVCKQGLRVCTQAQGNGPCTLTDTQQRCWGTAQQEIPSFALPVGFRISCGFEQYWKTWSRDQC